MSVPGPPPARRGPPRQAPADSPGTLTGIGALPLGAVPMLVYRLLRPEFFRDRVIAVTAAAPPGG